MLWLEAGIVLLFVIAPVMIFAGRVQGLPVIQQAIVARKKWRVRFPWRACRCVSGPLCPHSSMVRFTAVRFVLPIFLSSLREKGSEGLLMGN